MRAAPIRGFFKDSREKYEASIAKKDLEKIGRASCRERVCT